MAQRFDKSITDGLLESLLPGLPQAKVGVQSDGTVLIDEGTTYYPKRDSPMHIRDVKRLFPADIVESPPGQDDVEQDK